MVNAAPTIAMRDLAVGHAPVAARAALAALFALDDRMAQIVRTTSQPIVGQMRITWWRDALIALDDGPPPAEPILAAIAAEVLSCGVAGAALAAMTDGWEALVADDAVDPDAHAVRGAALFAAAARVLGGVADGQVLRAGEGWALADLARHLTDRDAARRATAAAAARFGVAFAGRWPRNMRAAGLLALLAREDLAGTSPLPAAWRTMRFRATGCAGQGQG